MKFYYFQFSWKYFVQANIFENNNYKIKRERVIKYNIAEANKGLFGVVDIKSNCGKLQGLQHLVRIQIQTINRKSKHHKINKQRARGKFKKEKV